MSIIKCIKSQYCDAVVSHCSEKNCTLRLTDLSNYVILKGEKMFKDRKICDHLIFVGNNFIIIAVVEFKGRNAKPSEIEKKLTNCSMAALNILERCSDIPPKCEFYHIVIVRNWRPHEYRKIVNMNVTVRGKRYSIIPKTKDLVLSDLIAGFE